MKAPYRRSPPIEILADYSEFYDDPGMRRGSHFDCTLGATGAQFLSSASELIGRRAIQVEMLFNGQHIDAGMPSWVRFLSQ